MNNSFTRTARRGRAVAAGAWEATVPYWPRWAIRGRADRRLRNLVRIAAEHVPYYRDRLARGEMKLAELRGTADLTRWPIVPPAALRNEPERLVSGLANRRHCIRLLSSGSTGGRKTVYLDSESFVDNARYESRVQWAIYKLTGKLFGLRRLTIIVRGGPLDELGRRYSEIFPVSRGVTQTNRINVFSTFDEKLAATNALKPDVVSGVAGAVADFFLQADDRDVHVHHPLLIGGTAEAISPTARHRLEKDCGIPVRLRYTSVESPRIGFECETGDGYHIDEDVCVVRIVDDGGHDLPEGQTGRVILTNLTNRATVLINYEQGDRGRVSSARCACGRRFKRLWLEETRETPLLRTPAGRVVHYGEVLRQALLQPGFESMQVIVESPDLWDVLVTTENDTHETWHDTLADTVAHMANNEVTVQVHFNAPPELSEGGKRLPVIVRCLDQPPYAQEKTS